MQTVNPGKPVDGPQRIESIDRAMQLLDALAEVGPQGGTLTRLSEITHITKPTAYRALMTMRDRGFVSRGLDGEYSLGSHVLRLSDRFFSKDNLQDALHPVLVALSRLTDELVHLGVWDGREVVYLDKVEPATRALRVWSAVGQRVPAASSALGRALLAVGNDDESGLAYYVESLPPDRKVPLERLVEAVSSARVTGFSGESEENEPGVACMGFPLLQGGRALAAMSITSVPARMTDSRRAELRQLIRAELPPLLPEGISLFQPEGRTTRILEQAPHGKLREPEVGR